MRLFKKKALLPQKRDQDEKISMKDKVANKMAGFFLKMQTKIAAAMNKRMAKVTGKRMKRILIVFCCCWGGLSLYYFLTAIMDYRQPVMKVDKLKLFKVPDEETENKVDKETYDRIENYKKTIDSMHEIIRPGLLDSMNFLEQIYLSQKKDNENK